MICHNTLRAFQHFHDNKHVTNTSGITRLAANLKHGIRTAFGIQINKSDGSISSPRLTEQFSNSRQNSHPHLPPQWQNNYQQHSMNKPKDTDQKLDSMCSQTDTLISLLKFPNSRCQLHECDKFNTFINLFLKVKLAYFTVSFYSFFLPH